MQPNVDRDDLITDKYFGTFKYTITQLFKVQKKWATTCFFSHAQLTELE